MTPDQLTQAIVNALVDGGEGFLEGTVAAALPLLWLLIVALHLARPYMLRTTRKFSLRLGADIWWVLYVGLRDVTIVLTAVIRIGKKSLKNEVMWALAAFAFIAIYFFKIPFPAIVLSAGIVGFLGGLLWKSKFESGSREHSASTSSVIGDDEESPPHTKPNLARAFRVSLLWLTLWLTPTLIVGAVRGWESTLFKEGLFFSKAAVELARRLTPKRGVDRLLPQRRIDIARRNGINPHAMHSFIDR